MLPKTGEDGETVTSYDHFKSFVPEAVTNQAYLRNYVPQERLDMYYRMVDEYKEAMRVRLEQNSWLDEDTRKEALRKLDKLVAARLEFPYGDMRSSGFVLLLVLNCRKMGYVPLPMLRTSIGFSAAFSSSATGVLPMLVNEASFPHSRCIDLIAGIWRKW